jgi:hypothetical protein
MFEIGEDRDALKTSFWNTGPLVNKCFRIGRGETASISDLCEEYLEKTVRWASRLAATL